MAKTQITAYDMKGLFESLWSDNGYTIIIQEEDGTKKEMDIQQYLRADFYTYVKDLRENSDYFEDENGVQFNFPNFDNWVKSYGMTQATYGQVELTGLEVVASEDIDMGSANAKISFIVNIDKADLLEKYLAYLRVGIAGKVHTFTNADGEAINFYANIGDVSYDEQPFDTPLGKCVVITTYLNISFIQATLSSNDSIVEISLNGTDYERLLYTTDTENITFTGKANLVSNKPYASGTINGSVSYVRVISYWVFTHNSLQLELHHKLKSVVNDTVDYNDTVNIPIWVREKVPYWNTETNKLDTDTMTTKMVIVDYKVNRKNCDFVNINLTLNRYGK